MKKVILAFYLLLSTFSLSAQTAKREIVVAPVLSDFPVEFCLLTHGDKQFVAYYAPDHQMMVASRNINEDKWLFQPLPSKIGWDGHNSIAMKVDSDNQIHLSGNMHVAPLMYLRTTKPLDITSFEEINYMVGKDEMKATYPAFMNGPDNAFIYHYRDGGSGDGNEIFNVYDVKTQTWSRLLDKPLTDGKGLRNAYMSGPSLGPDNYYHLVWVWRDSYHCETNNHLSYARSRNLKDWESVDGKRVELPITIEQEELWVDPIPVKAGLINGGAQAGFDNENRLLITYHKFDKNGNNLVKVNYSHVKYGEGYWLVDENTLEVVKTVTVKSPSAKETPMDKPALSMIKKTLNDCGKGFKGKKFRLEWETLPQNRDTMRTGVRVEPTILKVIEETIQ